MSTFATDPIEALTDEEVLARRDSAVGQMRWIRQYALELIESVPRERWFELPAEAPSNLAWQVGHLAVSQYGLMLFRQRGRTAEDRELMPSWLRKRFGRGSSPSAVTEEVAEPSVLLDFLARIHQEALLESTRWDAESLREPIDMPYAVHPTRLGALMFCPLHESLHVGQIGLLRRLLGLEPIR